MFYLHQHIEIWVILLEVKSARLLLAIERILHAIAVVTHYLSHAPNYPADLTLVEINAGLVMPYKIKALVGNKGIIAFFVLLFMALTSTVRRP